MQALIQYIGRKNAMIELFGNAEPYPEPERLSYPQVQRLRDCVEGDLSPENLTCDGELPRDEVDKKARFLNAVMADLDRLEIA